MKNKAKYIDPDQVSLNKLEHGNVRVGVLSVIPALIQSLTREAPDKILQELGINPGLLDYPENSISFDLVGELMEVCANITETPHFGLTVGQSVRPVDIGKFAELAIYAPDVYSALRSMILHVCVHDRGGAPTLTRDHGIARLGYSIYEPIKVGVKQINDTSLCIMCNLMRAMCGENWAPCEVHFSHACPQNPAPYETFFHAPLVFDSDMDALLFSDSWLQKTIPSADEQQFNALLHKFRILESDMDISLEEKIRSLVRPLIVFGNCTHEQIASLLAMHPRTLNRRLKDQGTTLRAIIGEMRFEIAKQMLLESNSTISEISTLLGYSEPSILAHSFQRWSGTTPSAWRIQNRQ